MDDYDTLLGKGNGDPDFHTPPWELTGDEPEAVNLLNELDMGYVGVTKPAVRHTVIRDEQLSADDRYGDNDARDAREADWDDVRG